LGLCGVAVGLGVRRAYRRLQGADRVAALPLVLSLGVFAVHAAVDYDADFLAVTGPLLLVVGVLLAHSTARLAARAGRVVPFMVLGVGAVGVVSLLLPWLSSRALDATDRAVGAEAVRQADRAVSLNPWSFDAQLVRAQVALDDEDAARAYRRLTALQPENADGWYFRGLFELLLRGVADECSAYFALNESYTRDPANGTRWGRGGALDMARDAVNNGACEPG
jgi:hypothetical protein